MNRLWLLAVVGLMGCTYTFCYGHGRNACKAIPVPAADRFLVGYSDGFEQDWSFGVPKGG